MKKEIKQWLGIYDLEHLLQSHTNSFQVLDKTMDKSLGLDELRSRMEEVERTNIWLAGICNALLEYLDVDYYVAKVPDHRYAPLQPRLRDEVKIRKNKKRVSK